MRALGHFRRMPQHSWAAAIRGPQARNLAKVPQTSLQIREGMNKTKGPNDSDRVLSNKEYLLDLMSQAVNHFREMTKLSVLGIIWGQQAGLLAKTPKTAIQIKEEVNKIKGRTENDRMFSKKKYFLKFLKQGDHSYKDLARHFHPDMNIDDEQATENFQALSVANDELETQCNPARRGNNDISLRNEFFFHCFYVECKWLYKCWWCI